MSDLPDLQGQYGGFISRAFAIAIDLLVITMISSAISWVVITPLQWAGIQLSSCSIDGVSLSTFGGIWCVAILLGLPLLIGVTVVGYFVVLWSLTGWTLGKALLGVRVVRTDGTHLGFRRSLIRFFGYFVSLIPLGAGFWWVLLSNSRQGWHDKMAGTYVVYFWEAHESERFLGRLGRFATNLEENELQPGVGPSADQTVQPALVGGDLPYLPVAQSTEQPETDSPA